MIREIMFLAHVRQNARRWANHNESEVQCLHERIRQQYTIITTSIVFIKMISLITFACWILRSCLYIQFILCK